MRTTTHRLFGLVAATIVAAGCGDRSPLTDPASAGTKATQSLLSPTTVHVVTRNAPLAEPITASAVIGAFGGTISIPGAGLTVVVPAFAVASPTQFTVTAVAGSEVAYEFEPHGIRFPIPLTATQDLSGTSAATTSLLPNSLVAGYFLNLSDLDQLDGTAVVSELLSTSVSALTKTATFPIFHFSGYLVATD